MIGKVNTGSKSSGGLVPQIIVTAPKLSTITVDFDSYTLTGEETEHAFVVETGMHQVTATLGTQTATEQVQVDKIAQFRIEIVYKLIARVNNLTQRTLVTDYESVDRLTNGNKYILYRLWAGWRYLGNYNANFTVNSDTSFSYSSTADVNFGLPIELKSGSTYKVEFSGTGGAFNILVYGDYGNLYNGKFTSDSVGNFTSGNLFTLPENRCPTVIVTSGGNGSWSFNDIVFTEQ